MHLRFIDLSQALFLNPKKKKKKSLRSSTNLGFINLSGALIIKKIVTDAITQLFYHNYDMQSVSNEKKKIVSRYICK